MKTIAKLRSTLLVALFAFVCIPTNYAQDQTDASDIDATTITKEELKRIETERYLLEQTLKDKIEHLDDAMVTIDRTMNSVEEELSEDIIRTTNAIEYNLSIIQNELEERLKETKAVDPDDWNDFKYHVMTWWSESKDEVAKNENTIGMEDEIIDMMPLEK